MVVLGCLFCFQIEKKEEWMRFKDLHLMNAMATHSKSHHLLSIVNSTVFPLGPMYMRHLLFPKISFGA